MSSIKTLIFVPALFLLAPQLFGQDAKAPDSVKLASMDPQIVGSLVPSIPLTVNAVDALIFGTLTPPTTSLVCAVWMLSADGDLTLTSGEGEDPVALDHGRGLFRLIGDPGASVTYSVAVTTQFADPDLSLTVSNSIIIPLSPGVLDASTGVLEVQIGGVLEICSGVVIKTHNDAIITMTADYTPKATSITSPQTILAATGTISATVSIATPLYIPVDSNLVFGVLSAPTDSCCEWTVEASTGNLIGTCPSTLDLDPSDHSRGRFTIQGEPGAVVTYSAAVTANFADAGLSLTSVELYPASPQILDGFGLLYVYIGGTLEICPGVEAKCHDDAIIEMTVNYNKSTSNSSGATQARGTITGLVCISDTVSQFLKVSPDTISATAVESGANPAPDTVDVTEAGGSSIGFTVSESISWAAVSPLSGTTPDELVVTYDITGLAPGTYTDSIQVSSGEADNSPQYISVSLIVNVAEKFLAVSPDTLSFAATEAGTNPPNQSFMVSETGGFNIAFTVSESSAWLSLDKSGGTTNEAVTASINIAGLVPGDYFDSVMVSSGAASNSPIYEYISLVVAAADKFLAVSPDTIFWSFVLGGSMPTIDSILITETGGFNIGYSVVDSTSWFNISPSVGNTPGNVWVIPDTVLASLPVGVYSGNITITSGDANNSPIFAVVILEVTAPPILLEVSPTTINLTVTDGGAAFDAVSVSVSDSGGAIFPYSVLENSFWFNTSKSSGTAPDNFMVVADTANLDSLLPGMYKDTIVVSADTAFNSPVYVYLNLQVNPSPNFLAVIPDTLHFAAQEGGPNPAPDSFSVTETGNAIIAYTLVESSPWLSLNKSAGTTPDTIAVSTDITGLAVGNYFDSIAVVSGEADNSPQYVFVSLQILACGDVNGDGTNNILDLTYIVDYFYRGGAAPPNMAAASMDGCPGVDVRDYTFIIDWIFRGGPSPCTGPINCASGVDAGAPDSLKLALSTLPAVGTNVPVVVECSVYVDLNTLSTLQFAWEWDNPNLQMDSALPSAELDALELGPYFFRDNDLTTTNDSQVAICSGTSINNHYPPNASGWRHLATYYMTASSWTDTSTLTIDTVQIPGLAATEYIFIPTGGQFYRPVWGGPINFNITNIGNLQVSPDSLFLTFIYGIGMDLSPDTVAVTSVGGENINFIVTEFIDWLEVSKGSGTTPDLFAINYDTLIMSFHGAATYFDSIKISPEFAPNSPVYVYLDARVLQPIILGVNPDTLRFVVQEGEPNPAPESFSVIETGGTNIAYTLIESSPWLSLNKSAGTTPDTVAVSVDISGLAVGIYFDSVTVASPEAANSPIHEYVRLLVTAGSYNGPAWYVDTSGSDIVGNGSQTYPFATIQTGIDAAVNGDTVLVADGLYTGDGNRDLDFGGKNIILRSENGPSSTVIDCQGSMSDRHRGFYFHLNENNSAIVEGLTIRGGWAPEEYIDLWGVVGGLGGAAYIDGSSPKFINCIFSANCSQSNSNTGQAGSAIGLVGSSAIFENCVFDENRGTFGTIFAESSSLTIANCTFVRNTGCLSGFIVHVIIQTGGELSVSNSIFAFNETGGGGFGQVADVISGGAISLSCINIFGNSAGDWIGAQSGLEGINGNFSLDPLFCDTASGDYTINTLSPCAPSNNSCSVLVGALGVGCGPISFLTCPPDTFFDCNNIGSFDSATATSTCDSNPTVAFTDSVVLGLCPSDSTIYRTWIASDTCGNADTCVQIITIQDITAPVITCPDTIFVQCSLVIPNPDTSLFTAIDNCDLFPTKEYVSDSTDGNSNPETITRVYKATDNCGNESYCSQVIVIYGPKTPVLSLSSLFPFGDSTAFFPPAGDQDTEFEFRINYQDSANVKPQLGYPLMLFDWDGNGLIDDPNDNSFPMSQSNADNEFLDGAEYSTFTTIPIGGNPQLKFIVLNECGEVDTFPNFGWLPAPAIVDDTDLFIYADDINYSTFPDTPLVNETVILSVRIHNTAPTTQTGVDVDFYIENVLVRSFVVDIPPRDAFGNSGEIEVSFDTAFSESAFLELKAVVDPNDNITELNEFNNTASRSLIVGEFNLPSAIVVSPFGLSQYYTGSRISGGGAAWYELDGIFLRDVTGASVLVSIVNPPTDLGTVFVSDNGTFSYSFIAPSTPGDYTLSFVVTDFTLTGSAETPFTVIPRPPGPGNGPNLVINFQVSSTDSLSACGNNVVTVIDPTVTNIGTDTAGVSVATIKNQGTIILSFDVPELPPGSSYTHFSNTSTLPASSPGKYTIIGKADADNDVVESIEYDNQRVVYYDVWCCPEDPKLNRIDLIGVPYAGNPIQLDIKLCNVGGEPAANFGLIVIDEGPLATDTILDSTGLNLEAFGDCQIYTISHNFSDPGSHTIRAFVTQISEQCRVDNDTLVKTINVITLLPDLEMHSNRIELSDLNPKLGDTLYIVNADIYNVGQVTAYNVVIRFNFDGLQLGDTVVIDSIPNYGANNFRPVQPTIFVTVDSCQPPVHLFFVEVDPFLNIDELSETNNTSTKSVIFCDAPDWAVNSINFGDSCLLKGDSITIEVTVQNVDSADTAISATLNVYYLANPSAGFWLDTLLIDSIQLGTLPPLAAVTKSLSWLLSVDSTVIVAEITNSIPFDYDLSNNTLARSIIVPIFYLDSDGDGFGDPNIDTSTCSVPPGFVSDNSDCDDSDSTINPSAAEICDGEDNNCNGQIDEGLLLTFYLDADSDGFGDPASDTSACSTPPGYVADSTDCNDADSTINPTTVWYADTDGDGFGNPDTTLTQCLQPSGYVLDSTDCDDSDSSINPTTIWYADTDGDGFGNPDTTLTQCLQPSGYVLDSTDCNDSDSSINPTTQWYEDSDGDGYGNPGVTLTQCIEPGGFVRDSSDCDDTDSTINPTTVWYVDTDGDGFGVPTSTMISCTQPVGFVLDSTDNCPNVPNPFQTDTDSNGVGDACCCIGTKGDVNGDGKEANILDLTCLVDEIFRGGCDSLNGCPEELDVNGDGNSADILDLTYLVDYIFRGGPPPDPCDNVFAKGSIIITKPKEVDK